MARSMVRNLMLLQRQTVLSPRMAGCKGCSSFSGVSVMAWLPTNRTGRAGLPDARVRTGSGLDRGAARERELRQARRERGQHARALLPDFRTLHAVDGISLPDSAAARRGAAAAREWARRGKIGRASCRERR